MPRVVAARCRRHRAVPQLVEPTETGEWAVRMLYRLGRVLLISRYPAGNRQRRPRERSEVEEWILPVAADRLSALQADAGEISNPAEHHEHPYETLTATVIARPESMRRVTAGEAAADAAAVLLLQLGEPAWTSPWAVRKLHWLGRGLPVNRYGVHSTKRKSTNGCFRSPSTGCRTESPRSARVSSVSSPT